MNALQRIFCLALMACVVLNLPGWGTAQVIGDDPAGISLKLSDSSDFISFGEALAHPTVRAQFDSIFVGGGVVSSLSFRSAYHTPNGHRLYTGSTSFATPNGQASLSYVYLSSGNAAFLQRDRGRTSRPHLGASSVTAALSSSIQYDFLIDVALVSPQAVQGACCAVMKDGGLFNVEIEVRPSATGLTCRMSLYRDQEPDPDLVVTADYNTALNSYTNYVVH